MILGRTVPAARIAVLHGSPEKGEAAAKLLRSAGHRVTIFGHDRRTPQAVIESSPDLLLASVTFSEPPLSAVIKAVRTALGQELPVVVLSDGEAHGGLIEADELIREPLDPGELALRVGALLRAQAEARGLKRKVQELLGLYKISWAFSLAGGAEGLYGHVARVSAELLKAEKGLVFTYEPDRRQMVAQPPGFGIDADNVVRLRYPVDEARSRWNFRKNGPLLSNRATTDTRLLTAVVSELGVKGSILVAPLGHGGRTQGLLVVADRPGGRPFEDEDLNLLLSVAFQASVAVENLRLHEELKRTNALLQEYDRVKSEFVAIVAHDFRKPLMAIRGFAELVLEEPDIPAEARQEFMRTVIHETEGLAHLADDTLLITRFETGEVAYRWTEVDLGPFILEAVPMGLSDHSVLMDVPPQFPKIIADPERLRQVLTNLTSNAIKYSPAGSSITIRCRERGAGHVLIEVVDRGLGIPEDQIPRLFQKFQRVRTEEHMRIQGTGLGLYICRLLIEGHGGQIWVESELGQGSTFAFALPLDPRAVTRSKKGGAGSRDEEGRGSSRTPALPDQ